MKIGKKLLVSLLGLSGIAMVTLAGVSLYNFYHMQEVLETENRSSIETLYSQNAATITEGSERVARIIALSLSAQMDGDFKRVEGELGRIGETIEQLYHYGGTAEKPVLRRYSDYIIGSTVDVSLQEEAQSLAELGMATTLFDNLLEAEQQLFKAFLVLENGIVFSSSNSLSPELESSDMRQQLWYSSAVQAGGPIWSEAYYSEEDKLTLITCALPVYEPDDTLLGVVAVDLPVSDIATKMLQSKEKSISSAFILDAKGEMLLSTANLTQTVATPQYQDFIAQLGDSTQGFYIKDDVMIGYSSMATTGWTLAAVLDYGLMTEHRDMVGQSVTNTGSQLASRLSLQIEHSMMIFAVVAIASLCLVAVAAYYLSRSITQPIYRLSSEVQSIGSGNLDVVLDINTGDELEELAQVVQTMAVKLKDYIGDLQRVTAEKERIGAELNVATTIQVSMLPCIFPAFPDRDEFDIFASMLAAKEVGGDFYDYFLIDDNHLAVVIADVSGKGIPAALFMVIAKTLIKNSAQSGKTPSEVFETVNNQLCENNSAGMFVTAFMGYLEMRTGLFTYVNAGHNPPVLRRYGGVFERLEVKPGFVLACMEDTVYQQQQLQLQRGDTLFLYTDGVTEAANPSGERLGENLLLACINERPGGGSQQSCWTLSSDRWIALPMAPTKLMTSPCWQYI